MRHFYLIVVLFCSLLFSHIAVGKKTDTLTQLKIGFVNAIKVMDEAPQVKRANRSLEREFRERQQKLVDDNKEIKRLEARFSKNVTLWSEEEARRRSREIRDKRRDLQGKQEAFREDYNLRRNQELDKIQKIIIEVIQNIAKKDSYDLILSDGVVWASKRVDITDKVLRHLKWMGN